MVKAAEGYFWQRVHTGTSPLLTDAMCRLECGFGINVLENQEEDVHRQQSPAALRLQLGPVIDCQLNVHSMHRSEFRHDASTMPISFELQPAQD